MAEDAGFYDLAQLATQRETARKKARVGIFSWDARTIRRMWERGDFPAPIKAFGRNLWPKSVIHEFEKKLIGGDAR